LLEVENYADKQPTEQNKAATHFISHQLDQDWCYLPSGWSSFFSVWVGKHSQNLKDIQGQCSVGWQPGTKRSEDFKYHWTQSKTSLSRGRRPEML